MADGLQKFKPDIPDPDSRPGPSSRRVTNPGEDEDFEAVTQTLKSLDLSDMYLNKFKENKIDDVAAQDFVADPHGSAKLSELIPICNHRIQFIQGFSTVKKITDENTLKHAFRLNSGCSDDIDAVIKKNSPVINPHQQAATLLREVVSMFENAIENLLQRTAKIDLSQFQIQASQERQKFVKIFMSKIKKLNLEKPQIITMMEDLESQMERLLGTNLKRFENQKLLNQVQIKNAVQKCIQYYREEMEKRFSSTNNHLEDFSRISQEILRQAINHCKEEKSLTETQTNELLKAMRAVHKEYEDKNYMRIPSTSLAIGIDLGTTFSCVGICRDGVVEIISNEYGKRITPSYVAFNDDGTADVGEAAKTSPDPQNCVFDAKRLIGRLFSDEEVQKDMETWPFEVVDPEGNNTPKIKVNGVTYFPEEISARVLQKMKSIAESYLNRKVENAVITVPAYFNDGQKQATINAGKIAGLNILRIINEPTAAAIAYKLHQTDDLRRNVLIFDLGGGTFDVAVLTMSGGEIEVKAFGGDTHLGGQDFDNELINYCIDEFNHANQIDLKTIPEIMLRARCLRRLRNACEQAKINLSSTNKYRIIVDAIYRGHDLVVGVSREQFEQFNQTRFDRCIEIVSGVIKDAKLRKRDVNDIVLVGGSTRIPKIQEMLSDFFNGKCLSKTLDPDEAVTYGASVQAAILNGMQAGGYVSKRVNIREVTPISLGIRNGVTGGLDIIIPKNTVIPHSVTIPGITCNDGQINVHCEIFEGENIEFASSNHLLGEFILRNIPRGKEGEQILEITMEINQEGILRVSAVVLSNGSSQSITISDLQGRLTTEQVTELMLANAS